MIQKTERSFTSLLEGRWQLNNFVCVGLDSDYNKLPVSFQNIQSKSEAVLNFNRAIIDATHDLVCAYKPNSAYYEALGAEGWSALHSTIGYIKNTYPDIPVVLDAKRGDIGATNEAYATAIFDQLKADAVTVHPYLGKRALQPFLDRRDKGVIVMGANSNKGADEFQDLIIKQSGMPLYKHVTKQVAKEWNANGNCGLTVGATEPDKIQEVRSVVGDMPLLILGVGAQGGEVEPTVNAAKDSRGWGMIINSSRSVLYASNGEDFDTAARNAVVQLKHTIDLARHI